MNTGVTSGLFVIARRYVYGRRFLYRLNFFFKDIGVNLMNCVHLVHDFLLTDLFAEVLNWRSRDV